MKAAALSSGRNMNKTIRNLAIAALFIFPGLSGFPQEVQQEETPAAQPVVVENADVVLSL